MNKYLLLVICGAVVGVIAVFGVLSYMRAESIKGKECNPNYSGCVAAYSCSGVGESVKVIGEDVYGLDGDGDGTPQCLDLCESDGQKTAPGQCGCGVPDVDSDSDGNPDCLDQCPHNGAKLSPGICGCAE